ncbi:hypothetical protein [Paenibacillus antarcticus]|uniref:Uncharacterized protein n=1 Tax=Paenibacillus antarcticus TaxID=253703 RepID=A0A168P5T7_9BACL|nr:hypothetical protein [Paenibacillus antarcticus]OAB46413.1 hypothetical protein PBAT_10315 [Paenibacillus antarcticus]
MKSKSFVTWAVIILAALGLLNDVVYGNFQLLKNLLLPVLVFVVIFLLFKYYQPRRFKQPKVNPSRKTMDKVTGIRKSSSNTASTKKKNYPFQVIDGKKGKNDDQMPKYH